MKKSVVTIAVTKAKDVSFEKLKTIKFASKDG